MSPAIRSENRTTVGATRNKDSSMECGLRGREKTQAVAGSDIAGMTVSGIAGLLRKGLNHDMGAFGNSRGAEHLGDCAEHLGDCACY